MSDFNNFEFSGRIVDIAPIKSVLKVKIESKSYYKDEEKITRVSVTFFGKKAEALKERLSLGQAVITKGTLTSRVWEDKDYMDLAGTECLVIAGQHEKKEAPPPALVEDDFEMPF